MGAIVALTALPIGVSAELFWLVIPIGEAADDEGSRRPDETDLRNRP